MFGDKLELYIRSSGLLVCDDG